MSPLLAAVLAAVLVLAAGVPFVAVCTYAGLLEDEQQRRRP